MRTASKPGIFRRSKVCRFCTDKVKIDYRDISTLTYYVTEKGKIIPRRISGSCALHQRALTRAIKRARHLSFLSYASKGI